MSPWQPSDPRGSGPVQPDRATARKPRGSSYPQPPDRRYRGAGDDLPAPVAERAGRIAGFSYVGPDDHDQPDLGELYAIHVDPAEVGRGTGRALMVAALATLYGRGWRRGVLWVVAGNKRARTFYARGGWRPDGVEREGEIGTATTRQLRYARDLP